MSTKIQYKMVDGWREGEREYVNAMEASNAHRDGLGVFTARIIQNGHVLYEMDPKGQVIRVPEKMETA